MSLPSSTPMGRIEDKIDVFYDNDDHYNADGDKEIGCNRNGIIHLVCTREEGRGVEQRRKPCVQGGGV